MSCKEKIPHLLLMLVLILADQASKLLVVAAVPLGGTREVLPGFFRLWHVRNSGAVWGFLSGHDGSWVPKAITMLAAVALAVVLYFFLRAGRHERLELLAYALILGGALGNLIDRLRLGYVVDFLDVFVRSWHWPTFNVADSGITLGVLLLALTLLRRKPCTPS